MTLPRMHRFDVPHTLCMKGIERGLEELLPAMTPLYIYQHRDGTDRVRWSLPKDVAERIGLGAIASTTCPCCGGKVLATDEAFQFDIARADIPHWVEP